MTFCVIQYDRRPSRILSVIVIPQKHIADRQIHVLKSSKVPCHPSAKIGLQYREKLIAAPEQSQEISRGLDGHARAMVYRLTTMTGLRANEMANLTLSSFDLAVDVPTVTIEAAYSKHRRKDVMPLHHDLVTNLRQWLSESAHTNDGQQVVLAYSRAADAKCERLFPGTWSGRAADMLRSDLDATGILFDTDDGVADFHSLRHSFLSHLATDGLHPKLAQQLARHSAITLTMDQSSHVGLLDRDAALESLPTFVSPEPQTMRATGTTDDASDFSCTKKLHATCRNQPFSTDFICHFGQSRRFQ